MEEKSLIKSARTSQNMNRITPKALETKMIGSDRLPPIEDEEVTFSHERQQRNPETTNPLLHEILGYVRGVKRDKTGRAAKLKELKKRIKQLTGEKVFREAYSLEKLQNVY